MRDLDRPSGDASSDAAAQRRYLEQFKGVPILRGQLVDFEIDPGALFVSVRHGLKRAYLGAFVVGQSVIGDVVTALDPTAAQADVNITTHARFGITATPSGAPLRVQAWIF